MLNSGFHVLDPKSEVPKARLRVDRGSIADVLSSVLASYTIEDVSVEDPPLEEVIASVFSSVRDDEDVQDDAKSKASAEQPA